MEYHQEVLAMLAVQPQNTHALNLRPLESTIKEVEVIFGINVAPSPQTTHAKGAP
jgi:hypothetical protein